MDLDVERLRKEIDNLRKNQELAIKWVYLRAEFREVGQDLHPPLSLEVKTL